MNPHGRLRIHIVLLFIEEIFTGIFFLMKQHVDLDTQKIF